jgi:hypothetical protein
MKLRRRALIALAAATAIAGSAPMAASAAAQHRQGAHRAQVADPEAQLVFDDYLATVNSIEVSDNGFNSCWATPLTVNLLPDWYWDGGTTVWPFTSSNCSSGKLGTQPLNVTDSPMNPPYHCLEDVSPFLDWNPGGDWHSCRITGKTPFYGYATSSLVW